MDQRGPYRVVQPYGRDVATESTTISEHATMTEGFAEIDRLAAQWSGPGRPATRSSYSWFTERVDRWHGHPPIDAGAAGTVSVE